MRSLSLTAALALAAAGLLTGCGSNNIGACTAPVSMQATTADGGTVTCECKGPCGCFYADGGRCPQ